MNMIEDAELLRCYSETRSEEAFTELVRRHLNLVYSAAIRQVGGDVHLAEDITQSVFGDLARKAASLSQHSLLAGWLYTSTHFAATKTVRGEQRRREREQEVYLMQQTNVNTGAEASWEQLRPVIDDAMHELPEADREAILQRYFEGKPFLQIGAKLGLSENAARMRVERALEKLRTLLAVRGVAAPAAALAAVLGAQAVSAAPAALLSTVVGASLATAAATGGVAAVWSAIASAKLKVAISIACALGAFVALFMQHEKLNQFRTENAALNAMQQSGAASDAETATLARGDAEELERLRGEHLELLRLRGEVGRLRREIADAKAGASTVVRKEVSDSSTEQQSEHQINVKARFVSGTADDFAAFGLTGEGQSSIIDENQMQLVLKEIRESKSLQLMSEMDVTTLSGRQAQITSAEPVTNSNGIKAVGPILDVVPLVGSDGQTIQLTLIGRLEDTYQVKDDGTLHLPFMADTNHIASAVVWDCQTIAVFKKSGDQRFVIFVTPTLIDRAGNRIHPEAEKPLVEPKPIQQ
ncbi:MAG: sigma-70 family RNA polymerase sigma factor [Verrucomicrobiota bacterium]|nr:sigma-70 family RNA polymerase sigma factor [Limisphaerales bacterium]